jgi:spore maturation protein SpmA
MLRCRKREDGSEKQLISWSGACALLIGSTPPTDGEEIMLNYIWLGLIIVAVILGGINGKIEDVTRAAIDAAGSSVTIAIGLIGVMALWLGIMKIAEDSGLMTLVARLIAPIMKRLFPEIPPDHPATCSG